MLSDTWARGCLLLAVGGGITALVLYLIAELAELHDRRRADVARPKGARPRPDTDGLAGWPAWGPEVDPTPTPLPAAERRPACEVWSICD